MGFGFMFLGYILLFKTSVDFFGVPLDITPDVMGFLLMSHGFTVASEHCKCFDVPKLLSKIGIAVSFGVLTVDLLSALKLVTLGAVADILSWLYAIFLITFTLFLLRSVAQISEQTGIERLQKRAVRNMVITAILFFTEYGLSDILALLSVSLEGSYVTVIRTLAGAAYVILNAALIFSCYMWICLEGDEDMPDNRKHKYKTPMDYFEKGREKYPASGKKKKRK